MPKINLDQWDLAPPPVTLAEYNKMLNQPLPPQVEVACGCSCGCRKVRKNPSGNLLVDGIYICMGCQYSHLAF